MVRSKEDLAERQENLERLKQQHGIEWCDDDSHDALCMRFAVHGIATAFLLYRFRDGWGVLRRFYVIFVFIPSGFDFPVAFREGDGGLTDPTPRLWIQEALAWGTCPARAAFFYTFCFFFFFVYAIIFHIPDSRNQIWQSCLALLRMELSLISYVHWSYYHYILFSLFLSQSLLIDLLTIIHTYYVYIISNDVHTVRQTLRHYYSLLWLHLPAENGSPSRVFCPPVFTRFIPLWLIKNFFSPFYIQLQISFSLNITKSTHEFILNSAHPTSIAQSGPN